MNNEIKFDHFENINELLEHIDLWYEEEDIYYERWFGLNDLKKLKDYITNLQEENKKLESTLNAWAEVAKDEEKRKYEFMGRNKKAIEYIDADYINGRAVGLSWLEVRKLLDILQGSDKE